jgi:alkylation response protein AidB-like acyl-CoA dehydrogenase
MGSVKQDGGKAGHAMSTAMSPDAARLIEAVAQLGPTISAQRDQIERERRLPPGLVETLRKLGFFSLWLARDFGGLELSLADYVRVIEALSRYDASVGWCTNIAAAYSVFSGYLPEPVARQIFVKDEAAIAGNFGPIGSATVVDGGYRVTGRWAFGSGINHSEWILGGCVVHDNNGPRVRPDGSRETTIAFFPASQVEVIDTWNVGGLRGTGSHDYQVADLFVPETHTTAGRTPSRPGTLYSLPIQTFAPPAIAAVPLGIARAALDGVRELSSSKTPRLGPVLLREKPAVQGAVGRAEGMLRAARAFLFEACDDVWKTLETGAELSLEQRAAARLSGVQVAEAAKAVVQIAYEIGGGTSVYDSCPLQRCFRDMYAAVQHIQVQNGNFETCGRVMLGMEPGTHLL